MASILRSSKFVRYLAGFARHVVINGPREFDPNLVNTTQCFCSILPRSLTSQVTAQHDQNLDRSLKRLDQDVRRVGRISRQDIEDVLEEIRSSRTATSSQSLLVIRCCGNLVPEEMPEVRTKLVQEIWNTLLKLNVPMDISHYNALLRVYLENRHEFSPAEFLSELEANKIEPNRVTYQRLISRYCQLGDIEGATRILEYMREKQLPVNEHVFNALIMGHSQVGDMESAESIVSVMMKAGLEATADTYTTLACGYAKKGDIDTINKLLEKCEQSEIYLVDKDYLDIVEALATNGHLKHIPVILGRVRKAFGYNQDAINMIYRLINNGLEEAALMVLETLPRITKPDGGLHNSGSFFIKQLVKAKRPLETILEYCKIFEERKLHDRPLLLATEVSIQQGDEIEAYALMKQLQNSGYEIRQHFFWPLILAKANSDPTGNSIIDVLLSMGNFNMTPSSETIREYVIPNIKGRSSEVLAKLRQANISVGSSACNLVYSLLQKGEIEEASIIISRVPAYYHPEMIKRHLTNAFYKSANLNAYVTILQHIRENLDRREIFVDHEDKAMDDNELIGQFVWDLTSNWRSFLDAGESVLSALAAQGLSIDSATAEKIQNKLGEKLTPEISSLLDKMTSGELTPVPVVKKPPVYTPSDKMNIPQLERLVQNLQAKGQDTMGLSRQLLTLYCRAKELEKAEALLPELDKKGFEYTAGAYAQLIELYSYHENLDKSLEYYNKLREMDTNLALDDLKVIRVVALLIKNNRFNEAIDLINEQTRDRKLEEQPFQYTTHCWRTLNMLAEQGKPEELETLFNILVKKEFIEVNNVMLGPLVKVHLVRNDLEKALEKFEWCCNQFRATPWKNELACKLIQMEDADKLQKLTDLSTSVHGEINSLYDLVFTFVECGRIRQARKILETPGLQTRPQRINSACQRFQQEDMVKPLEGLKDATKDLNHIDRSDIYYQLLLSYIKHEDTDKALGLWTQMQEEDMAPNDTFLITLGNFLIKHNISVPFAMPEPQPVRPRQIQVLQRPKEERPTNAQLFRQTLKEGNLESALAMLRNLRDPLSVTDSSNLIEQLILKDRLREATEMTLEVLDRSLTLIPRVFRFLLNNLAHKGDVNNLALIGNKINHETKKLLSFDNRMCHANLMAGKAEEYLNKLDREITNVKEGEIVILAEKFPRGGVLGIMEKHPELIDKYEAIALKYAQRGIVAPLNVLWSYYFVEGHSEKAKTIWDTYLHNTPRLMFQRVIQKARERSDENIVRTLIDQLKGSVVTPGALGNAYSCLLDILVLKNKNEEVVETFDRIANEVQLEYINRTALNRVKNVYLQMNKPFNYEIPVRNSQTNATSHSSDDDVASPK
ncbi:hypothetical protein PPYR_07404 [Photinus pyralis]|uniref:Uncharacterized protein n=1 Tax=Photinus pyralis TaxID=7054 RepID=A0A1Y1KFU1_PHOPY|nr:leucine-rich PPR motif-containing protein, mitochondrial [Photinus pyralis]KAB0799524.1 hypothetical protein PPYR_07404 [Photinus pyralis]